MSTFSKRLKEIIKSGMVRVDRKKKDAQIVIPANEAEMTPDDWIELLRVGGEVREELEQLGYTVKG